MAYSLAEEDYLKAVYHLSTKQEECVSTNRIASYLNTKASSVTDMMQKLSEKKLVNYRKYQGVSLTKEGRKAAVSIIRKHRLWEVFLVEHLKFGWDEVHTLAEQLEHIRSDELTNRLDAFLAFPKADPHGDPIPDAKGNMQPQTAVALSEAKLNFTGVISGVSDTSPAFLKHLEQLSLTLGKQLQVEYIFEFDKSVQIQVKGQKKPVTLSHVVCAKILVSPTH